MTTGVPRGGGMEAGVGDGAVGVSGWRTGLPEGWDGDRMTGAASGDRGWPIRSPAPVGHDAVLQRKRRARNAGAPPGWSR